MSALKYKNDQGEWVGVPSLKGEKGERGVSVSDVNVTPNGHLETTMSDGSRTDAGAIPQIITSVNGKTGAVELTASDVGALTETESAVMANALATNELIVKAGPMFGTSDVDVDLGIKTAEKVYISFIYTGPLSDGQTITVTPYWAGRQSSAFVVSGIELNKWYSIGHPMAGHSTTLPKIQIKTNVSGIMQTGLICVRYNGAKDNDFDTLANVVACDGCATDSFTSLSSTATSLTFNNSAKSKYEAYVCITTAGDMNTTITPTYSGASYSAGTITNAISGVWYKLARPSGMSGTEFALGVQLVTKYNFSYPGIVTLRYMSTPVTS